MKQRFSSLDLRAVTAEINEALQGTRLANIYDINSRTFLLKFAKQGEKHNILIESGYRVHLTDYARETAATPSNFCAKLRKHVRTRRITHAKQMGTDRVMVLTFGGGEDNADPERSYYIILEFYAGGNVILTDGYHKIISLLRVVGEDEGQKVSVGQTYDFQRRIVTEFTPISSERLADAIVKVQSDRVVAKPDDAEEDVARNALQTKKTKATKKKEKGAGTLKKALGASFSQYGAALVEHSILEAGLSPTAPIESLASSGTDFNSLLAAFHRADSIVKDCGRVIQGYIIAKIEGEHEVFDDFQPFLPKQSTNDSAIKTIRSETYNACVDKFFSSIESQKLEQRLRTQETLAETRIQASKDEQQRKIDGLVATQETSARKAGALEGSQGIVDEAINAVNSLLEEGMDWIDIETLIKTESEQGNAVAQVIKLPLKLKENKVTVRVRDLDELYEAEDYTDSGDETDSTQESSSDSASSSESDVDQDKEAHRKKKAPARAKQPDLLDIDVDLSLSAYANARLYYVVRRSALSKEDKTIQSAKKALRSTQQKIERDLKKSLSSEKALMRQIRKTYWFEKFLWFISSEGYLVLGGHDAQQNEQLFKKYFRKGDIYVHADLNGAASVIIKNTHADQPIPPSTLSQAGTLSVTTSQAWDAKMVISAWYVNYDQVSKTAPTGEYLTTGSFMVRGKKNFLPPAKLELGYGMLFVVDEASRDRHIRAKLSSVESGRTPDTLEGEEVSIVQQEAADITPTSEVNIAPKSDVTDREEAVNPTRTEEILEQPDTFPEGHSRYDLGEYGNAEDVNPVGQFSGKAKHMTAKERREIRKARGAEESIGTDNEEVIADRTNATQVAPKSRSPLQAQTRMSNAKVSDKPQPTRGSKAKKKKMAKYADQDEDDKALAQQLLGIQLKNPEPVPEVDPQPISSGTNQSKKAEVAKQKPKPRQNQEVAQLLQEEGIAQLDEDEQEQVTPLDIFISQPLPGDVLIDAIPTCGPYAAMARFKFKCKLQPGSTKKGKALRGVVVNWTSGPVDEKSGDKEIMWPRERELLKGLKDPELVSPVGVSKVKISMGKGEIAAKNKSKKVNKSKK